MAITNNFSKFGTTFTGAYHRVTRLNYEVYDRQQNVEVSAGSMDEEGNPVPPVYEMQWSKVANANGEVATYASQDARDAHEEALARTYFNFEVELTGSDNWMEQAYAYIKTLEAFDGAADVL